MENKDFATQTISVEHVTIRSNHPFGVVRLKLEGLVPKLDEGIFTLLQFGESKRALQEMEALPTLSIFLVRDHGALLSIAGLKRHALQYEIGNPFTASKMTRHQISAALYAPVRVLLSESTDGLVTFEYDRASSLFGQFASKQIDIVAEQLDQDLQSTLTAAAL
jgi:uncharacterized protein (DUF302 family)